MPSLEKKNIKKKKKHLKKIGKQRRFPLGSKSQQPEPKIDHNQ